MPKPGLIGKSISFGIGKNRQTISIVEKIAKGCFGSVWKACHKDQTYAVKVVGYAKMDERDKKLLANEVNCLREITQPASGIPGIPRYYDRYIDNDNGKLYIIMQYIPGKTLKELGDDVDKLAVTRSLLQIVKKLHKAHIAHRDIKPSNIIWCAEEQQAYLVDFGFACQIKPNEPIPDIAEFPVGTPYYTDYVTRKLDKIRIEKRLKPMDMWSVGVTLYEFWVGKLPFNTACIDSADDIFTIQKRNKIYTARTKNKIINAIINELLSNNAFCRGKARQMSYWSYLETSDILDVLSEDLFVCKLPPEQLEKLIKYVKR